MTVREKNIYKYRLGLTLLRIIELNKESKTENSIVSLRKLAAASGVEYSIIQKISSGQKDPQITTILALVEGMGMAVSEFFSHFEKISEHSVLKAMGQKKKKAD